MGFFNLLKPVLSFKMLFFLAFLPSFMYLLVLTLCQTPKGPMGSRAGFDLLGHVHIL